MHSLLYDVPIAAGVCLRMQSNRSALSVLQPNGRVGVRSQAIEGTSVVREDGARALWAVPQLSSQAVRYLLSQAEAGGSSMRPVSLPSNVRDSRFDRRNTARRLSTRERAEALCRLADAVRRESADLEVMTIILDELETERALASSRAGLVHCAAARTALTLVVASRAAPSSRVHFTGSRFGEWESCGEALEQLTLAALPGLVEELARKRQAIAVVEGWHDVVVASGASGLLAHEAFGHLCEADNIAIGSAAAGRFGDELAPPFVTVVDDGGRGWDGHSDTAVDIDDEGTPCERVVLIDRGRLTGAMHDRASAAACASLATGNARAESYADTPLPRMRNTAILPGMSDPHELVAGIRRGYFIGQVTGGHAELNGDFTFGASSLHEIVDGRIGRMVHDSTVAGNAFDVFSGITGAANNFAWLGNAWCRKQQQVPVGVGGPSVATRMWLGGQQ